MLKAQHMQAACSSRVSPGSPDKGNKGEPRCGRGHGSAGVVACVSSASYRLCWNRSLQHAAGLLDCCWVCVRLCR